MGSSEILVIVFAAFLLFGGKRLPEIIRTVGRYSAKFQRSWNGFKKEAGLDVFDEVSNTLRNPQMPPPRPVPPKINDPKETEKSE